MFVLARIRSLALIACVAWLAGCATPLPNNHLNTSAKPLVGTFDVFILNSQDTLVADIQRSNITAAAGGGLLFALIDAGVNSARAEDAAELVKPIQDNLADFDTRALLSQSVKEALSSLTTMKMSNYTVEPEPIKDRTKTHYAASNADAVLFLAGSYRLTQDLNQLIVSLNGFMLPRAEALMPYRENPKRAFDPAKIEGNIYRNNLEVAKSLGNMGMSKEEAAAKLASDKGVAVRAAFQEAVTELAAKLVTDISATDM
jgi:hypothetical protein